MQFHRDNHYVPQFYLKHWAIDNKVKTYRLLVSNQNIPPWKAHSVKSIAFHKHLYTYLAAQGETDEFERWLDQKFEAPAQPALEKLIKGNQISRSDWQQIIRFLAAQDVRTPARLIETLNRQNRTLPEVLDEALQTSVSELKERARLGKPIVANPDAPDPWPIKVKVESASDGDGGLIRAEATIGRMFWLRSTKHLLTSTIAHLLRQRWTVLMAPEGVHWPTSDDPVIKLNYYEQGHYTFGGGWGFQGSEILLPLTPNHLLYSRVGSRPPQRGSVLSMSTALEVRRFIVEHAHRYVYSLRADVDIENIRPRKVCSDAHAAEQAAWQNWNTEQSQSEAEFHRQDPACFSHRHRMVEE
ncbi:DUF4238 domain-containing protein [Pseudomonas cavernicola]|uniref:DUF4238 domain-containing protein n=1 Tax=Pseudomonas cavernicola TaxID=2320866 RepID=A0A418XM59_9PSED|nr:DUF4238 domain-containing protein [Pseudomonas cavernicola]RJG13547.1 DUF4238 domain-containing protein [Pseudomonas cavernicola]